MRRPFHGDKSYINSRFGYVILIGAAFSSLAVFLAFFIPARPNQFVALDDYGYIVENQQIARICRDSIVAAFTSFTEGNWHPLTTLSLMLDRQIWGLDPTGFHLTSILIHSATVFWLSLLFYELLSVTFSQPIEGSDEGPPPSRNLQVAVAGMAGALFFGLHPLRVESVVWASERKDVLFLFFVTAALWYYLRFAREASGRAFWRSHSYQTSLCLTGMALMSKSTAVSLPLVLLLLDWYPLGRVTGRAALVRCAIEKVPFMLLACIDAVVTLFAQRIAMDRLPDVGLASRLLVACRGILFYLAKTVWPAGLAAFYDHPGNVVDHALAEYLGYAAVVVTITIAAGLAGRRRPLWLALWLFYIITLFPMLGVIQVGKQWVADRYSYLPALGLSLLWGGGVSWLVCHLRDTGRRVAAGLCAFLAAGQLTVNAFATIRQIPYWHDTGTLSTRVIDLRPHRLVEPYYARVQYRIDRGEDELALADINEAIEIALREKQTTIYPQLGSAKAQILYNLGRFEEALAFVDWAVQTSTTPLPADFILLRENLLRQLAGAAKVVPGAADGR